MEETELGLKHKNSMDRKGFQTESSMTKCVDARVHLKHSEPHCCIVFMKQVNYGSLIKPLCVACHRIQSQIH